MYHSVSKMVNKLTNPIMKNEKKSSNPNHLLPSASSADTVKDTRSKSTSNINKEQKKEHPRVHKKKNQMTSTTSTYVNGSFHYPNKKGEEKAVPPKRPPPPKSLPARYQDRTYANWHRSSSDSDLMNIMYANFPNSYLENGSFPKYDDSENIYDNEDDVHAYESIDVIDSLQSKQRRCSSLDDTYIMMSGKDDYDKSDYVTMSRDECFCN